MEITINEEAKTIKIVGTQKLSELLRALQKYNIDAEKWSIIGTEKEYVYYPGTYPCPCPSIPSIPSVPWITYATP